MSRTTPLLASLLVALAAARPAAAHSLGAEAKLKGNRVEVEAFFSDNTPARDARVSVQDAAEKPVADGRTDDQGRWHFDRPAVGRYHVTVDAGDGHRVRVAITIPGDAPPTVAAADVVTVGEGQTREEFTRFPWLRVALGLALIALAAFGWRQLRRPAVTA